MIFEEMMTSEKPEARQNLKELCYKFTQLKNEYKGGLTPPPKEISQKLGITVENIQNYHSSSLMVDMRTYRGK